MDSNTSLTSDYLVSTTIYENYIATILNFIGNISLNKKSFSYIYNELNKLNHLDHYNQNFHW